ncbi:MAG: hypothetical protein QOE05_2009 [Actinomycetota bacterium]|jgi:hypothetical protein|nr:hypothetical protein [Actinomycetota bacterium]
MTDADPTLLGIYLNDHLAGATAGLELFRRAAGSQTGPTGDALKRLTAEVEEDRETLLSIMRALGFPVRQYKVVAAWAAEKAGRLKLNGRLLSRSPLSDVIELEGLHLGVLGKAAGWRLLRTLADAEPRLDTTQLDGLIARAERQAAELDELRLAAGRAALAR